MSEFEGAITRFCERLQSQSIDYVLGGSVASGIWGDPRHTNDVDVEVWLSVVQKEAFLAAFATDYLISESEIEHSLSSTEEFRSVQVLDTNVMLKFDCFLQAESDEFASTVLSRSRAVELIEDHPLRVAAPEHILLRKLRWYELGRRVSERQWRDLRGLVRGNPAMDWEFVERWSSAFGLQETLRELREQA